MQENQKETSYSDGDVITEFDRYLFAEGTHYEIYKKLGAHLMTQNGVPGTYFAVWAPNADGVSVVGNFNGWDAEADSMSRIADSGIYGLFIPWA